MPEIDEKAFEAANAAYLQGAEVRHRDRLRSALLAYESAKAAPGGEVEGWKLVPVDPTPKMLQDAAFNLSDEFGADFVKPLGEFARALWTELLAASPAPAGKEEG